MESAAVMRSFNYSTGAVSCARPITERPGRVAMHNSNWFTLSKSHIQGLAFGGNFAAGPAKGHGTALSCAKTCQTIVAAAKSDVLSASRSQGLLEKNSMRSAMFPSGFEALVMEVCDETEVAELKIKVGDFEMHLKRNVGATEPPTATAMPSAQIIESAPASPPSKSSTEKTNPFTTVSVEKSAKLAALEASGSTGYVLVSSPIVGSFHRGRKLKEKKQPPVCKEGDLIREGQVIGFLDQFGTELPVKSDVAGEVLKFLFDEGEGVGYGDPLLAVLPSFHGIK